MNKKRDPWWKTAVIKVEPNKLLIRGYRISDLIGRVSYADMLYLLMIGELPTRTQGKLIEAILVAICDHGPGTPSIAVSRMAATCGITFNSCVATGINVLGEIHGGAIGDTMEIFYGIRSRASKGEPLDSLIEEIIKKFREGRRFLPGYGHPIHTEDSRIVRLFELAEEARRNGEILGTYIEIAKAFESWLEKISGKKIPMNVDAGVAAVSCELGLPSEMGKALAVLSRALGIVAHTYEELKSGSRLKGPCPPDAYATEMVYVGPGERDLPQKDS